MEEIVRNINSPAWWFTGVFFILVGLIISGLVKKWIPSLFSYLSESTSLFARGLFRKLRLKYKLRIKSARFDDVLVLREIIKSYILLALFLLSVLIFFSTLTGLSIDFELSRRSLDKENLYRFVFLLTVVVFTTVAASCFPLRGQIKPQLTAGARLHRLLSRIIDSRPSSTVTDTGVSMVKPACSSQVPFRSRKGVIGLPLQGLLFRV